MSVLHVEVAQNPSSNLTSAEVLNVLHDTFEKFENPVQDFQISACKDDFFTKHIYAIKFGSASVTYRTIRFYEPVLLNSGTYMANSENVCFEFPRNKVDNRRQRIEYHVFRLDQGETGAELMAYPQNQKSSSTSYCDRRILPSESLFDLWDSLIFQSDTKYRLINYIRTGIMYTTRMVNRALISGNKVIHLHGPPGTGKKSLCQALAQKATTSFISYFHQGHLLEINCSCLFSKVYSESERLIKEIFRGLDELVQNLHSIIFLVINEVEAVAHCRNSASMCTLESCNCMRPIDIFLSQINRIQNLSNVVILTTSYTSESLGIKFVDRAEKKMFVGNPPEDVIYEILNSSINELIRVGIIRKENHTHISLPSTLAAAIVPGSSNEAKILSRIAKLCVNTNASALRQIPFQTHVDYFESEDEILLRDFLAAMEKSILKERGRIEESLDLNRSELPTTSTCSNINVSTQTTNVPNSSSEGHDNAKRTNETIPSNLQQSVLRSPSVGVGSITNRIKSEKGAGENKRLFLPEHQGPTVQANVTMKNKNSISEKNELSRRRAMYHNNLRTGATVSTSGGATKNLSVCQQSLKANEQQQSSVTSSSSFPIPLATPVDVFSGTKGNPSGLPYSSVLFPEGPSSLLSVPIKSERLENEDVSTSTGEPCVKRKKHHRKPKATLPVPMPIVVKVEPVSFGECSMLPQSVETPRRISNPASDVSGESKAAVENRRDSVTQNQNYQLQPSLVNHIPVNGPEISQPEKRRGLSINVTFVKPRAEPVRNPSLSLVRIDPAGFRPNPPSGRSSTAEDMRKKNKVVKTRAGTGNLQLTETIAAVQEHAEQSIMTQSSLKEQEQQQSLKSVGKGDADLANDAEEELPDIPDTDSDGSTWVVRGNKQKGQVPVPGQTNSAPTSASSQSVNSSGTSSCSAAEAAGVSRILGLTTTATTDSDLVACSSKRNHSVKCSKCKVPFYPAKSITSTSGRQLQVQASKNSQCEKCQNLLAKVDAEYQRKQREREASTYQQLPNTKKVHPQASEQQWQQQYQYLTKRKHDAYEAEVETVLEVIQKEGGNTSRAKKSKFETNRDETKDRGVQVRTRKSARVMNKPKVVEGPYYELIDFDRKLKLS